MGREPSALKVATISKNREAEVARLPKQAAYVARTRDGGSEGAPGRNACIRGKIYSGNTWAFTGDTTVTSAIS